MPDITIVTESELRAAIQLDQQAIDCIENAFHMLATKDVLMPPIMRLDMHDANGEVDVKSAYVPSINSFAIKISPGFFDNPAKGLPSTNGMMNLFSATTGMLENVLLDNGYLTNVRTAAAGAVAAKHLSRTDSCSAAILGAGAQAALQLEALTLVRPIKSAKIWARDKAKAEILAHEMTNKLGIEVIQADTVQTAITDSDIIVSTTPTSAPLVTANMLSSGQHLTAMGSDAEHKQEINADVFTLPDILYVADSVKQTSILGELHHAITAGHCKATDIQTELGQVIAGQKAGRSNASQITFADLTGTGVQDTAIATLARQIVAKAGAGTIIIS